MTKLTVYTENQEPIIRTRKEMKEKEVQAGLAVADSAEASVEAEDLAMALKASEALAVKVR